MRKIINAAQFKNDPIGTILDLLIVAVANLVVPVPLTPEMVRSLRGPVLGILASLFLMVLFMIITIGSVILSPLLLNSSFLQQLTSGLTPSNIASDDSFSETTVPIQNPFGGQGLNYTTITAHFLDSNYFLNFGRIHTGMDLVPNESYFKNSKTYKETNQVVIFSTINGSARYYIDQYGSETVELVNAEQTAKVAFLHLSKVLVSGGTIKAGTAIGIMGKTGLATGEHLHYEVRLRDGSSWRAVNPLNFIQ